MKRLDIALLALALGLAALYVIALLSGSIELWKIFSALGVEYIYVALSALIYCFNPRLGYLLLSALLLSANLNILLKNMIAEPRPPRYLWKVPAYGYAFPSGHSQVSSTFWYTLSMTLRRTSLLLLATVLVISIATSRVMLGVHWVQDVVGGIAIGLFLSWIITYLHHKIRHVELIALVTAMLLGIATVAIYGISSHIHLLAVIFATAGSLIAYPLYTRTWLVVENSTSRVKILRAVVIAVISLILIGAFKKAMAEPYSDIAYLIIPTVIVALSAAIKERKT